VRETNQLTRFARMELRLRVPMRPGLLKRGFFSSRVALYPFDHYDHRWFLNDWAVENRLRSINPPDVSAQLGNKLFFHLLLRELGFAGKAAPLIGMLNDGQLTSFSSYRSVAEAIEAHGGVVVKPVSGFGGRHVRLLGRGDELPAVGNFIVEGVLRQHAYAAAIFPGSVNTIRVFTLRASAGEEPFIAGAAHRFGVSQSAPVDNFSKGGVATLVDLETGRLSVAKSKSKFHVHNIHVKHPDTGVVFEGTVVPRWEEVKAFALQLAGAVPGLKLAGWDVCVTAEGPRLIEGNGGVPNPDLIQSQYPILLNPQTRRFFLQHGVITRRHFDELEAMARESEARRMTAAATPPSTGRPAAEPVLTK
jgi:hypothetical protein